MSAALAAHCEVSKAGHLPQWVVYGPETTDLPGSFVGRLFIVFCKAAPTIAGVEDGFAATTTHVTGPTLDAVRRQLPPDLMRLPRSPDDDRNIIEVWL